MSLLTTDEWLTIPGGVVTLAAGGYLAESAEFVLAPFAMARYPVTNQQFAEFIAARGYHIREWWTAEGWAAREKGVWEAPRYWDSEEWNRPTYPVVGVSWYECLAYSRWLSGVADRPIALPTEQQWQRAGQGDDGRLYPWGNETPDETLCNWNRNVDETTPVNAYPAGVSPYGVWDMCGNVWEWCLTGWESGAATPDGREARLLRGGSWSSDSLLSLRVTNRSSKDPNTRLDPAYRNHVTVGFRCVRL
jgi:formylglycine-generating enzyme required for sulfatase activity